MGKLRSSISVILISGFILVSACTSDSDMVASKDAPASQNWGGVTQANAFDVRIAPRDGAALIGQFHNWTVRIVDRSGRPVYPARVGISGGMPGHGHGMPTQPQVTEYLGDGRYLIEGVKFNMAGQWRLLFAIETATVNDRIEIEVDLAI